MRFTSLLSQVLSSEEKKLSFFIEMSARTLTNVKPLIPRI